jgi:NhaP-type Na+/H+ or K+/H+ antiporter
MNFRYTPLIIGLLVGIALGILYGWVIRPIEIGETTPNSLQEEYHADIVLMVAEIFAAEKDVERARQRMTAFGFLSHKEHVTNALNYAKAHDLSEQDIELLTHLFTHLDLSTPQLETSPP